MSVLQSDWLKKGHFFWDTLYIFTQRDFFVNNPFTQRDISDNTIFSQTDIFVIKVFIQRECLSAKEERGFVIERCNLYCLYAFDPLCKYHFPSAGIIYWLVESKRRKVRRSPPPLILNLVVLVQFFAHFKRLRPPLCKILSKDVSADLWRGFAIKF